MELESRPKYYVNREIKFPNISIRCTVSYSSVAREPEMLIGSLGSIDQIMREELQLPKDAKGQCNIKYKLISLPSVAMTSRWTGIMEPSAWQEFHRNQVLIEGSFRFTYRGEHQSDETVWHTVNVECINTTAVLD